LKTYGTLASARFQWHAKLESHVFMKFDRFFGGADKQAHKMTAQVFQSPENARDLLWFMARYPLDMSDKDRTKLEKAASAFEQSVEAVAALLDTGYAPQHIELALPPRAYQLLPAELALASGGVLCGDDVGLGKTVEGICLLARSEARPALVVTLTHLTHQWAKEIKQFAPELRVHIIQKSTAMAPRESITKQPSLQDIALMVERGLPLPDVFITAYTRLYGWREWLSPRLNSVIYDEAHELRNGCETKKGQGASLISGKVKYRMGLTATPVYNYGGEIYNVVDLCAPGVLGSRDEFGRMWGGADTTSRINNPAALGLALRERGIFIRRTKTDVGRELPKLTIVPQTCDADEAALHAGMGEDVEAIACRVLSAKETSRGDHMQASGELDMKMRQATGIAKAPHVAEFVRLLCESGEKVVVFAWHRAVYDILEKDLAHLKPVFYTGAETTIEKQASVHKFVSGDSKVFIASLRAGAGLDGLQHTCRIVLFAELDWTPAQMEQCVGRVNRDGQKDPVIAYYLISETGSDPVIADTLGLKRVQAESLREGKDTSSIREQRDAGGAKKLARSFLKSRGYTDERIAEIEGVIPAEVAVEPLVPLNPMECGHGLKYALGTTAEGVAEMKTILARINKPLEVPAQMVHNKPPRVRGMTPSLFDEEFLEAQ
jgi:superfamily II DNA or RNA helicase